MNFRSLNRSGRTQTQVMNTAEAKRVLETALICAVQPLPLPDMKALFEGEVGNDTLRRLLDELVNDWQDRGVELVALATGWRFQSRPELRPFLDRLHPEKPPRYSRAAMETLAIVAYRQPVTRGDIEDIRGVTVSSLIVKQLEDRGWIEAIGYREAPGRPALFATTKQFLDDLGLASLDQLPPIDGSADDARATDALAALQQAPTLLDEVPADGQTTLSLDGDAANDATAESAAEPLIAMEAVAFLQLTTEPTTESATDLADGPVDEAASPPIADAVNGSASKSPTHTTPHVDAEAKADDSAARTSTDLSTKTSA